MGPRFNIPKELEIDLSNNSRNGKSYIGVSPIAKTGFGSHRNFSRTQVGSPRCKNDENKKNFFHRFDNSPETRKNSKIQIVPMNMIEQFKKASTQHPSPRV